MKHARTLVFTVVIGAGLSLAVAAAARQPDKEIAAALVHAGAASHMDTVAGVHLHLHHVLNCVLGPGSKLYSAQAEALSENSCKGLGDGALSDAGRDRAVRESLERAARVAEHGIVATDLAVAQRNAAEVMAALRSAQQAR